MTNMRYFKHHQTGETVELSPIAADRFFDNRDPREWIEISRQHHERATLYQRLKKQWGRIYIGIDLARPELGK